MCSKFMPQIEARNVGTVMIAAQAEICADDGVLLDAEKGEVRLEDRGEQLALAEDLLVDPARVVVDVAEVAPQLVVHLDTGRRTRGPRAGARSGATARWNSITSRFRK